MTESQNPENLSMTAQETLSLRRVHISDSCRLHYTRSPLKIINARGQYMYNENNDQFLDCTSRTTAVGHCHDAIVDAACSQMGKISISPSPGCSYYVDDTFSKRLLQTLPGNFEVCLFTSSGGEANDIALQLARLHTGRSGVAVVDGAFHGAVVSLMEISPKAFRVSREGQKPWVHVIPCPDWYRSEYATEEEAADKYFEEAVKVFEQAKADNYEVGCFICEPLLVVPGVIVPPKGWLKKIYTYIQENGGVVIADEIITGLGRTGSNFWAFQSLADGAIPDIVTIGKPLGNGHPVAAVLTTKKVASLLSESERQARYVCGPVETEVGLGVLQVLEEEGLISKAKDLGRYFMDKLKQLKWHHPTIGDVRGMGLLIGVEIITGDKVPAPELADRFTYQLKDRGILVAAEGERENVLVFIPPYCITRGDVDRVIQMFNEILYEVTTDVDIDTFLGDGQDDQPSNVTFPPVRAEEISAENPLSPEEAEDYQELD